MSHPGKVSDLAPGSTVIVQGTASSDGTIGRRDEHHAEQPASDGGAGGFGGAGAVPGG